MRNIYSMYSILINMMVAWLDGPGQEADISYIEPISDKKRCPVPDSTETGHPFFACESMFHVLATLHALCKLIERSCDPFLFFCYFKYIFLDCARILQGKACNVGFFAILSSIVFFGGISGRLEKARGFHIHGF